MKSAITPNELHFVRNHGGIPTIKDEDYILEIGGLIGKPGKLTLAQIKDPNLFPQIEVPITLQCCGTRRVEQIAYAVRPSQQAERRLTISLVRRPEPSPLGPVGRGRNWNGGV